MAEIRAHTPEKGERDLPAATSLSPTMESEGSLATGMSARDIFFKNFGTSPGVSRKQNRDSKKKCNCMREKISENNHKTGPGLYEYRQRRQIEMNKLHSSHGRVRFDPPVKMTHDGRDIHVSIGLPGIMEEQILIELEKTIFTVSIAERKKKVKKAIRVPEGTRFFKKKFSDGILEIILEKPVS